MNLTLRRSKSFAGWFSDAMAKELVLILTISILMPVALFHLSIVVNATPAIGSSTITINPSADSYVNSSDPTENYGNLDRLLVGAQSQQYFVYLMFPLSGIPSGANIISAELSLYLSSTGGEIYGFPADKIGVYYCSDNSWTEDEITWNNKPVFNVEPTDIWSFSVLTTMNVYKLWDVTANVRNAFSSGFLTEALKFESKTDDGYAVFQSKDDGHEPRLEVEYSVDSVYTISLEATQDMGDNDNIGFVTLEESTFSLPSEIEVVAGDYQLQYSGGYTFMRWETSGGASVSDTNAVVTTLTVSSNGTLRAVGNVNQLEYCYDSCSPDWSNSRPTEGMDAVRFTPLVTGKLLMARFYIRNFFSFESNNFNVHVMDANRIDLIQPFEQTPTSEGWFNVDLSAFDINLNEGIDFYVGIEWINNYCPDLGEDSTDASDRSWYWNGTVWQEAIISDFMIRAVVGNELQYTTFDHIITDGETDFHVSTKSTSTVSDCQLIKDDKELVLEVSETSGCYGYCTVTIPNQLLEGPYALTSSGQPVSNVVAFDNGTFTSLEFTYSQAADTIEIVGTTVIPELSSTLMLLIFTFATFIAVVMAKKKTFWK